MRLFPSAADPDGRQGFVRVVSRSDGDGKVTVRASDGTDADYEALTLALKAGQAAQFNSDDLELGNAAKGLTGSTGPGSGDWTLALSGEGIEFDAYAYVRSRRDGFLAPMGAAAPVAEGGRFATLQSGGVPQPRRQLAPAQRPAAGQPRRGWTREASDRGHGRRRSAAGLARFG